MATLIEQLEDARAEIRELSEALKVTVAALEKLAKPYDVSYETNYAAICDYDKRTAIEAISKIKKESEK